MYLFMYVFDVFIYVGMCRLSSRKQINAKPLAVGVHLARECCCCLPIYLSPCLSVFILN